MGKATFKEEDMNMKKLYIDCGMGAAGDMLGAALLELMSDPEDVIKELNGVGIPGVTFTRERVHKCGVAGTQLLVCVNGEPEETSGPVTAEGQEAAGEPEQGLALYRADTAADMAAAVAVLQASTTAAAPREVKKSVMARRRP